MMPAHKSAYTPCAFFPFPHNAKDPSSSQIQATAPSPQNSFLAASLDSPKLQGKFNKAAVNGQLSIANILANAFLLPNFPRRSPAFLQSGKSKFTFSQVDSASKRLALLITSLALGSGTDDRVPVNNDGEFIVLIIMDDVFSIDEHFVTLILAVLRLGAAYFVVTKHEILRNITRWNEIMALIDPVLVITTSDPTDLSIDFKKRMNIVGREHFDDFPNDDEFFRQVDSDTSVTADIGPLLVSSLLVRKIRSSIIQEDLENHVKNTIKFHLLWELALELKIANDEEVQILPFRSDVNVADRAAFIFSCKDKIAFPEPVERFVKIGHKAIRNRIAWERLEFPIRAEENLCITFPLNDPRSLVQMFNALIHGRPIVLPEDPAEFFHGPFLLRKIGSDSFKNVRRLEVEVPCFQELLESVVSSKLEVQLARIKLWIVSTSASSPFPHWLAKQFFTKVKCDQATLVVTYGTGECLWSATWSSFSNTNDLNKHSRHEKHQDSVLYAGTATMNSSVILADDYTGLPITTLGQSGRICITGSMIPTNGYCGSSFLGRNVAVLETNDTGKLVQDKAGDFQLIVDPPKSKDMNRRILLAGKLIDLDDISSQVQKSCSDIREAFAFVCQRGRDIPEVVVAVVIKDFAKFTDVKGILSSKFKNTGWGQLNCFPVHGPAITRKKAQLSSLDKDEVDVKSVRASYFSYLGRATPQDWQKLMPGKTHDMILEEDDSAIEKGIHTICRAVAFSLGIPLKEVIDNFDKSFWVLKGTPLRALFAVKSCVSQGKLLSVEDFMVADRISDLGFRLMFAAKSETQWLHEVEITRQVFMYSILTQSDHTGIQNLLVRNMKPMFGKSEAGAADCEKYAKSLIETFDNALSVVGLSCETRQLQGVAFIYRGNLKSHFTPKSLEDGMELYNTMIQSCRHLTRSVESKNIAKCYLISINTQSLVHPSQVIILLRDLIRESMAYALSVECSGYLVCSQDPLVQEVCCTLLGFSVLSELQMNMFRNKKFEKPFAHLDDHQLIGVYYTTLKV